MALNNPNTASASASAFESQEATDGQVAAMATADKSVETTQAAAAPATDSVETAKVENAASTQGSTAVVTAATSALAAPRAGSRQELLAQSNVMELDLRNALPVTWEDFQAINASQGQFQLKGETPKQIGTEVSLKLVSFQDQWVSAPKDNDAEGDDLVRYSDDGVVLNDDSGRTLKEHQQMLEEKGEEPTLSHRVILVGELVSCGEAGMDEIGNLVQIILSDSARRGFISHTKQVAYQIANGRMTRQDAEMLKLTAQLAGTGKKQYTLVKPSYADGHGPNKANAANVVTV